MSNDTYEKSEADKALLGRLSSAFREFEEGEVMITDKVSYLVRNVVKRARKNYAGIYDEPIDPNSGDEKYWVPLTETMVDNVVKEIDLDLKHVRLYTENASNVGAVKVFNSVLKQRLAEAGLSKALNEWAQMIATDGIGHLKLNDAYDPKLKRRRMIIECVDTLNFVADESCDDVKDSDFAFETHSMSRSALKDMDAVWDKDAVDKLLREGSQSVGVKLNGKRARTYEITECWGVLSEKELNGGADDKFVEAHVVVANLNGANKVLLLKEKNKWGRRPYVQARLKKVIGRRTGRGVPEALFGTQKYMNMVVEMRKQNSMILGTGLFKARRSMGDELNDVLSQIVTGGIVLVDEQSDFEQLQVNDYRESSYRDERALMDWGERASGANDVIRGDQAAMSAPATNALIKDRNARGLFELVQENMAFALEEFIMDLVIPWVRKNVKPEDVVRVTGDPKDLEELDQALVEYKLNEALHAYVMKNGAYPEAGEVLRERTRMEKTLKNMGDGRFVKMSESILSAEVGVHVDVTEERTNKQAKVAKLTELLTLSVNFPQQLNVDPQGIVDVILDVLGVDAKRVQRRRVLDKMPSSGAVTEAKAKEAAAMKSQPLNALTGKVAPEMNSAMGGGSPQGMPTELTQMQTEGMPLA